MEKYPILKVHKQIGVWAFVSCFEMQYQPDFSFEGEMHDFWELVFVRKGCAGITAGDRILELHPGQIIFHKPMEFHRIWSARDTSLQVIILSFYASGSRMDYFRDTTLFLTEAQQQQLAELANVGARLFDGYFPRSGEKDPATLLRMQLMLELLLLSLMDHSQSIAPSCPSQSAETYREAIRYLSANLSQPLTIKQIAQHCKTSESNIKKIFHKYTGAGVIHYFNQLKINEAKRLLQQNMSVREVSEQLGYTNQSYFTLVFKRETGSTPVAFRRAIS